MSSKSTKIIFDNYYGYVHFTNENGEVNKVFKVISTEIKLALYEVYHPEIRIPYFEKDNDKIPSSFGPLRTYSFLYKFADEDSNEGALWVYNGFDHNRMSKFYAKNELFFNFLNMKKLIARRENYNLIYAGERNEG